MSKGAKSSGRPMTAGGRTLAIPRSPKGVKARGRKATWFERSGKVYGERAVTRCYLTGEEPLP